MKSMTLQVEVPPFEQWGIDKAQLFQNGPRPGQYFVNPERPTAAELVAYIAEFTGHDAQHLERVAFKDLVQVYRLIFTAMADYKVSDPADRIVIDGQAYTLRGDFTGQSVGWHRHCEMTDFTKSPESLLALLYIEEGMRYGHPGEHDTVLNPTSERAAVFRKHGNMGMLVNASAFFLRKHGDFVHLLKQVRNVRTAWHESGYAPPVKSQRLSRLRRSLTKAYSFGWRIGFRPRRMRLTTGTS